MSNTHNVTAELAQMFQKIHAMRRRVWKLALLRAAVGMSWFWLASLLLLGLINLLYPFPGSVRIGFLSGHLLCMIIGLLVGLRYSHTDKHRLSGRGLRAWALRCEEQLPAMENRLVTCVDIAQEPDGQEQFETSPVAKALLRDTSAHFRHFDASQIVPSRHFKMAMLYAVLPLFLFLCLYLQNSNIIGRISSGLYSYKVPAITFDFSSERVRSGHDLIKGLSVSPGSIEVPRGSSVSIEAAVAFLSETTLDGPPVAHVLEHAEEAERSDSFVMIENEAFETEVEEPTEDASFSATYTIALHDVKVPTDYQVILERQKKEGEEEEKGGLLGWLRGKDDGPFPDIESPLYTITPFDPPQIELISSEILPPAYTQKKAETLEGTYLSGMTGSKVTMRVRSDHVLSSARLVGETVGTMEGKLLKREDGGNTNEAEFEFEITEKRSFHLEITDKAEHGNLEPPLIVVKALSDRPPTVKTTMPGADWSIHPIAEVDFGAEASDDFSIAELGWEYRINGEDIVRETLFTASEGAVESTCSVNVTLHFEELGLEVGDSIYYRFTANDGRPDKEKGQGYSQPFFIKIRSFDQIFYQAESGKGGGGGGGTPPPPPQRDVIVATMRLADRLDDLKDAKKTELSETIARTQREVRVGTQRVREKLRFSTGVPNLAERLEHLDSAVRDMETAEGLLNNVDPEGALPSENSALSHMTAAFAGLPLLAAKMMGESTMPSMPPTSLSGQRLELEDKNSYEMFNAPKQEEFEKDLADALEKVREMAKRQKDYRETLKREEEPSGSGDPGVNFENMRKKVQKDRRDIERLSEEIEKMEALDDETLRKLREALEKSAKELARLDEALANKDTEKALSASARALDEMLKLELGLNDARKENAREQLRALASQIREWEKQQKKIQEETNELSQKPADQQMEARKDTVEEQTRLSDETRDAVQGLDLDQVREGSAEARALADIAKELDKAAQWMAQAAGNIDKGNYRQADRGQSAVMNQLARARKALQQHLDRQANSPDHKLAKALEAVRELREKLFGDEPGQQQDSDQQSEQDQQGKKGEKGKGEQGKGEQGKGEQGKGEQGQGGSGQGSASSGGTGRRNFSTNYLHRAGANLSPKTIRVHLESLQKMFEDDYRLHRFLAGPITELRGIPASALYDTPEGIAVIGDIAQALDEIEELLLRRLQLADQMQRLQQTRPEDMPPEFRDMAAKYFEELSKN